MKKWWIPVVLSLAACGQIQNLSQEDQESCPAAAYPIQHEATIHFSTPPPAKLFLEVDGQPKFSDCAAIPDQAPVVRLSRSGNSVTFVVQHFGAYPTLPEAFSFRLSGRESCMALQNELLSVRDLPLKFVTDYPNGKECGSRTRAQVTLIKQ
jgi:hypothetical protein